MRTIILFLLAAFAGTSQTIELKVAIHTEGSFRSTGTAASDTGVFYLPTNSFKTLDTAEDELVSVSVYNVGVFNGTPNGNGNGDQFELRLYQSVNGGPMFAVGQWNGHVNGDMIRFDCGVIHQRIDGHVYTWRLTRFVFPLGEFTPVDAVVSVECKGSGK
jgi:hypothetical protein